MIIVQEWKRCRPWIEAALAHAPPATHTIEDIELGICNGQYTFWPAGQSAAITEIHVFPRARHLHIFLAGGDLEELKSMVPMWQAWARTNGCSRVTLCGRRGWERALKQQGWEASLIGLGIPVDREKKSHE